MYTEREHWHEHRSQWQAIGRYPTPFYRQGIATQGSEEAKQ